MGGCSFELADEVADHDRGNDADTQMHVRFNAANFMDEYARRVDATAAQVMVDDGFDLGNEERGTFLGVPSNVEVDFGVIVAGHCWVPRINTSLLCDLRWKIRYR